MKDLNDNSKTPEVQLSPDAHWLYVVAYKRNEILLQNEILRKEAYYLHAVDDILQEDFVLGKGRDRATKAELAIDDAVVAELKKYGEAEKHWLGRDIWFAYKLVPLKFADMMRKKID